MRKLVLLALASGALVILQRRAARLGFVPAFLLTAAAEKGLGMFDVPPKTGPKPGLWRRLFPSKPHPNPCVEPET
jgi:hypothetical protein